MGRRLSGGDPLLRRKHIGPKGGGLGPRKGRRRSRRAFVGSLLGRGGGSAAMGGVSHGGKKEKSKMGGRIGEDPSCVGDCSVVPYTVYTYVESDASAHWHGIFL